MSVQRLRRLVKFLLFREDFPIHRVFDVSPVYVGLLCVPILVLVGLLVLGYVGFGVVGFLFCYVGVCILAIEVPHCIFDRGGE